MSFRKNTVLESICAYYSALLWLRHNATLLQAEPSESFSMMNHCIAMDTSIPVLIMDPYPPYPPWFFFWLPSLCLTIAASPHFVHSAPLLRELETTNCQHHWEDADTAGHMRRPPPDGLDRLLRGSLRSTAHLQWLSQSCCWLINDDRYGGA